MEEQERQQIERLADILARHLLMQEIAESWMQCSTHHDVEVLDVYGEWIVVLPIYTDR